MQKTDFVGIRLPDKVEDKGLLAVTKIVIKSLKPQDSKQFDDNIYLKEVYNKLVNWFNIQVKKNWVQANIKVKKRVLPILNALQIMLLNSSRCDLYLQNFDDNVDKIFQFYFYSPICQSELYDVAEILEYEFKLLGTFKNIQWILSWARALTLLETNCKVLVFDFEKKTMVEIKLKASRWYKE